MDADHAKQLANNGCKAVFEIANMPCTRAAVQALRIAGVTLAPSKAVNAGGFSVSGLENTRNRSRMLWDEDKVDDELKRIMDNIRCACVS